MQFFNLTRTLTLLLLSLRYVLAANIIFPIYISPSPAAWAPLYNAIASNPRPTFQIIINPNSGPGSGQYPSSEYIAAIKKLRTYSNVQLLGYVHISYCSRPIAAVQSDISKYAGWSSANIGLDGIFIDEAPESYTAPDFSYLTTVTTYARTTFRYISLNPGILCDSSYFTLADTVCVFEDRYSAFNSQRTLNSIPTTLRSKSTIIIHDFNGNQNTQASLVTAIANSGISGMYITTTGGYQSFSKYWTQFVTDVTATA